MEMGEYLTGRLVAERLNEAREFAARAAVLRSARPPRQSLRVALGSVLIRTGQWVLGADRSLSLSGRGLG